MTILEAGSIGARLDITVRAGDTLGPYVATLTDQTTGLPIDLSGWTFDGAVSKLDTADGNLAMTVTITDAVNGKIQFQFTSTAQLEDTDSDFFSAARTHSWKVRGTDTVGTAQTYLYGYLKVAKQDPT